VERDNAVTRERVVKLRESGPFESYELLLKAPTTSHIFYTEFIMDRQSVYSLNVLPPDFDADQNSRTQIQSQLREFILEFRLDNSFIYR
jgi:hypothetical protein